VIGYDAPKNCRLDRMMKFFNKYRVLNQIAYLVSKFTENKKLFTRFLEDLTNIEIEDPVNKSDDIRYDLSRSRVYH